MGPGSYLVCSINPRRNASEAMLLYRRPKTRWNLSSSTCRRAPADAFSCHRVTNYPKHPVIVMDKGRTAPVFAQESSA
jgi:hypothetical protein